MTNESVEPTELYVRLMQEVKERLFLFDKYLGAPLTELIPSDFLIEMCFLQHRLICETLAHGCLVAHGEMIDAPETRGLLKESDAGIIIKRLEKLLPDFFPRPVVIGETSVIVRGCSQAITALAPSQADYLTKAEFLLLYAKCDESLHRGSMDKIFLRKSLSLERQQIVAWRDKLVRLLELHVITFLGGQTHWLCALSDADRGGCVSLAPMKAREV